jgi:ribonucleoside-diphosphate reductase alpha chain
LLSIKKSKQGLIPQVVPNIYNLRAKYTLAFELDNNKGYTNIVSVIQKYTDQAISANHYYNFAKYENSNLPMSEVVRDVLYAYKMGVKTLYYANTDDGKTDNHMEEEPDCDGGACKL